MASAIRWRNIRGLHPAFCLSLEPDPERARPREEGRQDAVRAPQGHADEVTSLPRVRPEKAPSASTFFGPMPHSISSTTFMSAAFEVRVGDCLHLLRAMPSDSVQCAVTSPPYWSLRDYGVGGQLGREATPDAYIAKMVEVFREVRRVLRPDGTLWLNIGDRYASKKIPGICKPGDLVGIPWLLALALRGDGWRLRSEMIWHKPNPMPESVKTRPTRCHEQLFLLTKSAKYFYDPEAVAEPAIWASDRRAGAGRIRYGGKRNGQKGTGQESFVSISETRNKRTVWTIAVQHFKGAHFAVFPEKLVEPCILAGSRRGDIVLDPFSGSGTAGLVAVRHDRHFIGLELNPEYAAMARQRISESLEEHVVSPRPRQFPGCGVDMDRMLFYCFPVPVPFFAGSSVTLASAYIEPDFQFWQCEEGAPEDPPPGVAAISGLVPGVPDGRN